MTKPKLGGTPTFDKKKNAEHDEFTKEIVEESRALQKSDNISPEEKKVQDKKEKEIKKATDKIKKPSIGSRFSIYIRDNMLERLDDIVKEKNVERIKNDERLTSRNEIIIEGIKMVLNKYKGE